MLKMVDGTGIIGLDMVCPLGVSTPQPPNYDRVELEGAGMLVLPNSLDAPLERLELGGKMEQVTTTGAQLWDNKRAMDSENWLLDSGVPYSYMELNLKPNTTYTISFDKNNMRKGYKSDYDGRFALYIGENKGTPSGNKFIGNSGDANDPQLKLTFSTSDKPFYANFFNSYSDKNAGIKIVFTELLVNTMLSESSTATPYEPHTGNKPSPSPEYPQEIKNSGKWNEDARKYEVDVKITGKNLFDKDSAKKGYEFGSVSSDVESKREGWFVSNFIPVTKGKVYISGKSTGGGCKLYNKDKLFVKNIQATSGLLAIEEGISYIRLNGEIKDLDNVQVEYGSVSTPYEPYKKTQTLTLTSDRPITKWDKLVEQGGQIGWLYGSNTVVLDGSETWVKSNTPENTFFSTDIKNKSGRINTSLCKTYKNNGDPVFSEKYEGKYCIYSDHPTNGVDDTCFRPPNETVTTTTQWKEWLAENPIEICYQTQSKEFVPLPESEQNAIRALKTYYPTTVITADGGELAPDIKVTYRKEI